MLLRMQDNADFVQAENFYRLRQHNLIARRVKAVF